MRVALNYVNHNWLDENGDQTSVSDLNVNADVSPVHYIDYDLAGENKIPQRPFDDPERLEKHPNDKPKDAPPEKLQGTLTPSDDVYTSTAGDSHTSNFTAPSPYTSVQWYVKSPMDTSDRGTLVETDTGDGSATTASLSYTFATDAATGTYIITAYVTTSSGVYEVSYTVTLSTVPGAPAVSSATLSGDTSVVVSWSAPGSDGGATITDYEYRYQLSDATEKGEWTSAGADLSETISGLTPGTSYTVEVRAKNSVGYSVASASYAFSVPAIPPSFAPAAGSSLTATAGDTHVCEVRNSTLYGAWLYVNGKKIKWEWGNKTATRLSLRYTFPKDVSGTYTMAVYVYERDGSSYSYLGYYEYKVEVSNTPGVPLSLSATAGDGTVTLSWLPPVDDGNSPILRYEYRYGVGESVTTDNYTAWTSMGNAMATYSVSPLTNDISHIFEVRAVNAIGDSDPSAAARATPSAPRTIPGRPTGGTATASNGVVTLNWNAPTNTGGGIDTYEYRVDPNNDGSWNDWESLDSSGTSATLNLQNGRHYGIQVRAKNSAGTSIQSTTLTAMPVDPSVTTPSAPRNLTATAEDGQVRLSWNTPATGTGIIDYEYKYDTNDDGSWQIWRITNSTSTSYTISGLTNDTVYAFKVRARNAGGAGSQSDKVTATPTDVTVPGKTRNLTAVLRSDGRMYLDWDAPIDNGGSAITDYECIQDTNDDGSWGSWRTTGDTSTDEYITGGVRGTTYAFKIRARNQAGAGRASDKATVAIPAITLPSAPQALTATAGYVSVSLSWNKPVADGYSGISEQPLHYAYRYRQSGGTWGSWSAEQSQTSVTINTLTHSTAYQFEVRAKNESGSGAAASVASTTKAPTIPGKPTGVSANVSNGVVTLNWDAPESNGGGIDTYEYRVDPNNDGTWNDWESLDSSSTSATLNLQNGRVYGIQVRAKNSAGTSTQSTKYTVSPIDPSVPAPSAPTGLHASAGDGQVSLSWTAPGTGIIEYEYKYDTNDDGSWQIWRITNSTSTSYTISGLTNDTVYAFKVRARNAGGAGSQSGKVTATPTDDTVPSAPRNLTVSGIDRTSVFLDWDAPVDDGGRAITSYRYHIDTKDDGSWEELGTLNSISTSVNLYHFTPGETYAFMISAVNEVGASTPSNKAVITMQSITAPSAPQDLTAVAGNASVYLSWSYPADDGGEVADYQYRYRQSGGTWSSWSAEQWQSYVTVGSLINGTSYDFEVVGTNAAGMGTAATVSATPTGTAVPGVPQYFDTFSDNGAVDLWWDPPEYDGGSPITDYEYNYRQSGGSWNGWASAGNANVDYPEYKVTGLTNGTTYQFKVRARNAVGPGESTNVLSETPKTKKPDAPTGVSAAAGSTTGTIVLTWTAPNANGSSITGYKYRYCKWDNGWKAKNWTDLASTGSTNTSYTVTGLESGEVYRFRVVATNSVGDSRTSRVAQAYAP